LSEDDKNGNEEPKAQKLIYPTAENGTDSEMGWE
jgi:hypothetical protein